MKERLPKIPRLSLSDRVGNVLDSLVYLASPRLGAGRMALRQLFRHVQQHAFEGAAADKMRGSAWLGSRLSPDSALESDLDSLRKRSAELYRNDAIGGAIDSRVNHVVGEGFTPQSRIGKEVPGNLEYRQQIEAVHKRWSLRCDRTGRRSLWQLCRLAERLNAYAGESFTVMSDMPGDNPIPLVLEVVDPDRVETPPENAGNPLVRMGIEYDKRGRVVAYHIRQTHPDDTLQVNFLYDRVPAHRVCHVYESWFAGQSRGLPWMCRALLKLKDVKDLDEAAIIAAQVEACYAAFIKNTAPGATAAAGAATDTSGEKRLEDIVPGTIRYLDPMEDVSFSAPQRAGAAYSPFQDWNYRRIAAALNFPYEMLVKNWGALSHAAGRLVLIDAYNDCRTRQKLMCEGWLCPIWNRMTDEAVTVGAVKIPPATYFATPWLYQEHTWTPPVWRYAINPVQEFQAKIEKVRNNVMPKADLAAEEGYDLETVAQQRQEEVQREEELGITPKDEAPEPEPPEFERADENASPKKENE